MIDPYMQFEAGTTNLQTLTYGLFYGKVLEEGYTVIKSGNLSTNTKSKEILNDRKWSFVWVQSEDTDGFFRFSELETLVFLSNEPSNIRFVIAGYSEEKVEATLEYIKSLCPPVPSTGDTMPICFWHLTPHGANYRRRELFVPPWLTVNNNYPTTTRTNIDTMMKMVRPEGSGKLILWHGAPGTGKSSCIRSLAHEWSTWAEVHYIVDPEKFFGEAFYLMEVILSEPNEKGKWRLLVIEDADEFLVSDAKQRSGQALSRLLNCTDGLIGQGLGLLTVITTNEPITKIHPAISREGRCLANIEFPKFQEKEAETWLKANSVHPDNWTKGETTLAELYEAIRKTHIKQEFPPNRIGVYI